MEGNNMNGFNAGNVPGATGVTPQPTPMQTPVMPTMGGTTNPYAPPVMPQPMSIPSPVQQPVQPVQPNMPQPTPAFSQPVSSPMPSSVPTEPVIKEFTQSADVSSITSSIMRDRTKKKGASSGLVAFLAIIILMETVYIGYDFCKNHLDMITANKNNEKVEEPKELDGIEKFGDIEQYEKPENIFEEYKFKMLVDEKEEEVTLKINDEKKLIIERANEEDAKVFENIENVRYFLYTTLKNGSLSEVYVSTNDYKAYKIVFEDDTEKKYDDEDFYTSAVEITTENNDIASIRVDRVNAITETYEPSYKYTIGATLTDNFTYKVDGENVTTEQYEEPTIVDSITAVDGIALVLDKDSKVSFYDKDELYLSKLVDDAGEEVIAKDAFITPIKTGESYIYKYYILTEDNKLLFTFNTDVKSDEDTQSKVFSPKEVRDFKLVDSKATGDYKKYSSVSMNFVMTEEPLKLDPLEFTPKGMDATNDKNIIYVLASHK